MKIKALDNGIDVERFLHRLDVDKGGISILASKHTRYLIAIEDLHVGGANILKQDALSVGADVAVPKGTVVAQSKRVDALIIANERQLRRLAKKAKKQPFSLPQLGAYIESLLSVQKPSPQIMGIINANDDSFYPQSRFSHTSALTAIEKMIEEGADIIDIGAVSSRPGAAAVDEATELERLRPIVQAIYESKVYTRVRLSIDSYAPKVVEYVLDHGFSIINDITGFRDDRLCELAKRYNATAIVMHMQGTPQTMQLRPNYEDVVAEVYEFFRERLLKLSSFGVEDTVLDIGIGFGKTLTHNLELMRHIAHFRTLNRPILVGASRKSLIDAIVQSDVSDRLGGTLALHMKALEQGASIVRVHDVFAHKQAFGVLEALRG